MATFLSTMIDRAKADKKTIVLPEGNDERILELPRRRWSRVLQTS